MLNKENILKKITQEDIMKRYFPYEVNLKTKYKNPYRPSDKNAGCAFNYSSGVLNFYDGARESYDCFKICQLENNCSFHKALKIINKDFNLDLERTSFKSSVSKIPKKDIYKSEVSNQSKDTCEIISVYYPDFSEEDLKIWAEYYITKEDLIHFRVKPVEKAWINDAEMWISTPKNPIYEYPSPKGVQLYRIKSKDKNFKFRTSINKETIFGVEDLPSKGEFVFITSSFKDRMVNYKAGQEYNVAPIGEGRLIPHAIMLYLLNHFEYVVINYNNDEAGKKSADKLNKLYKDTYLFFTEKGKDPGEVVKNNNLSELREQINEFKKKLRNAKT